MELSKSEGPSQTPLYHHTPISCYTLYRRKFFTPSLWSLFWKSEPSMEKHRFLTSLKKLKGLGQQGQSSHMPTQAGPSDRLDPRRV